ncbi:relaxase/mobilization nuclease domain-containing protein [Marinifilum fragile]|uniref:relaxase/mobilization nuclease domain-containing protein n=1 Tax=Marinifilum fragile TaxID=570161 RepID=UPI002AAB17EF|nr:relaxase/mobilization nuclease domain-containing protein [Marinifilum fragile]
MIGRITTGKDIKGLLEYLFKDDSEILQKTVLSDGVDRITWEFNMLSQCNQRIEKPIKHFVLSFAKSDEEKLDNEKLIEIADKYLEDMGYMKNQYVMVRHNDTERLHVHIAVNRIGLDVKCVTDSFEKVRSRNILRQLEKQYDLEQTAEVGKGKEMLLLSPEPFFENGSNNETYILNNELTKQGKSNLAKIIYRTLKSEKCTNFEYFKNSLMKKNIGLEFKNSGNVVYFEFKGINVNGGELYKKLSKYNIEQEFRANILSDLRNCIKESLNRNNKGRDDFFEAIKKMGISIKMNKSKNGYSFLYKGESFKASVVDRRITLSKIDDTIEFSNKENAKDYIFEVIKKFEKNRTSIDFDEFIKDNGIVFYNGNDKESKFLYNEIEIHEGEIRGLNLNKTLSTHELKGMIAEAIEYSTSLSDFIEYLEDKSVQVEIGDDKLLYKLNGFEIDAGKESLIDCIEAKFSQNLPEMQNDKIQNKFIPINIGRVDLGEKSDEEEEEIKRRNKGMEI